MTTPFEIARIRSEVERNLRESEERLRLALTAGKFGDWQLDLANINLTSSAQCKAIFGRGPDEPFTYEMFRTSIHPEDREMVEAAFKRAIKEVGDYEADYRCVWPDGGIHWINARGRAVAGDDGRATRMVGVTLDITERKQAEEERAALLAREREAREEAETLNQVSCAIAGELDLQKLVQIITDAGTKLTGAKFGAFFYNEVNEEGEAYRLYTLSGAPREAFEKLGIPRITALFDPTFRGKGVVRSDDILTHPDYGKNPSHYGMPRGHLPVRSYLAAPVVSRSGEVLGGLLFGHPEPSVFTERAERISVGIASQAAIAIDNARFFSAAQKEIAQRKKAEEVARESEERYRAVLDSQAEMLCRFRLDGTILFVNPAYAEARGATPEALIGGNFWDFITEKDRPGVLDILSRLTPEALEARIENRFETTDGVRWILWTNRALAFDADGRLIEAQSSGIDITDRKRMEEALKEADRRKDEFLAMLAHELRNPLAPILNAAHALRLVGPADANQQWAREVIERQTRHLARLVDDLLDVSRITRGKVTLARELLDLSTIINRAVETSRPLIDERRHKLTVAFPPEPARVEGDLTRLVQVVGNLLNNAAKYTDEGRQIWLEAAEEGDEAVIRVRDNGMGISADLLPHVFALFTQAERSLDRSHGGLGIGLTLVRHLVEMHGGRVEARSEGPGRGSEFIVRLPALAQGSAAYTKEAIGERARPASGALKILVVEDNVDSAESMALLLRLNGHEVRIAHDGSSALAEAHSFVPQIVLCDIGLPGMDGYEVAARLREQEAFKQTPLIALTGYGQEESRRRAKEAGFDYHLVKPVEPGALNTVLNSPLSNGRAQ